MDGKKICPIVLTAVVLFFFLAAMPVSAELIELWNKTYDTLFYDCARGVATDAYGNVIVTGGSNDRDYHTIKYDPFGNVLWERTYYGGGVEGAHGVATDASGNVIVTGSSDYGNYYTIKYDPGGKELWNRTYDGNDDFDWNDGAHGVATDTSGNVVVTGGSDGNFYTIKYDPVGNELWNRTYDGGSDDYAFGVATDVSGNVIVTGWSFDGSTFNYYTIKYDPNGNELWNRTYDNGNDDRARGVATDTSRNVIVTGSSFDGSTFNYYTIKYDPDGNELWNRIYDNGNSDGANGVATDAFGNVIVTGFSEDETLYSNFYTIMYDPVGNELWNGIFDNGFEDGGFGVATDAFGNVIVTGITNIFRFNTIYYTIKYGQPDVQILIEQLSKQVKDLNLKKGLYRSLDSKLNAALQDLNADNDAVAISSLEDFINSVEAQRDKKINADETDKLIVSAQAIIDLLTSS